MPARSRCTTILPQEHTPTRRTPVSGFHSNAAATTSIVAPHLQWRCVTPFIHPNLGCPLESHNNSVEENAPPGCSACGFFFTVSFLGLRWGRFQRVPHLVRWRNASPIGRSGASPRCRCGCYSACRRSIPQRVSQGSVHPRPFAVERRRTGTPTIHWSRRLVASAVFENV